MFNVCHVPKYQTVKTICFSVGNKQNRLREIQSSGPQIEGSMYLSIYIYNYDTYIYVCVCLESSGVENLLHHDGEAILEYLGQCGNQTQWHQLSFGMVWHPFLVRLISDGSLFYHVRKENQNSRPRPRPCPPVAWIIRGHRSNNGHGTSERSIRGAVWCCVSVCAP